jgi:hypothetical protein
MDTTNATVPTSSCGSIRPVLLTDRSAVRDTVVAGVHIPRGCLVTTLLAAASGDLDVLDVIRHDLPECSRSSLLLGWVAFLARRLVGAHGGRNGLRLPVARLPRSAHAAWCTPPPTPKCCADTRHCRRG